MFKKKPRKPFEIAHGRNLAETLGIAPAEELVAWSQVRRCHRCDQTLIGVSTRVAKCDRCGARFAPFFFAELTPRILSESKVSVHFKVATLVATSPRHYRPLVGLTWWWRDGDGPAGETIMVRA